MKSVIDELIRELIEKKVNAIAEQQKAEERYEATGSANAVKYWNYMNGKAHAYSEALRLIEYARLINNL